MRTQAMIMAGGRGERMARSGVDVPKPLVEVAGRPLLEWNLRQVLRSGVERVTVSVRAGDQVTRAFVADRLVPLGARFGVQVDELVEHLPLGNIGATGAMAGTASALLVVYADNLTGIDLRRIVDDHVQGDADLTLAVHLEPFRLPYGRIEVLATDSSRVSGYREKPTVEIPVSSAVMVLGPSALGRLPRDRPTGISELAQSLIDDGSIVRAWVHRAPWIDVNHAGDIERAAQLLAAHPRCFDLSGDSCGVAP